jgi:Na+/H+-dicarboxylate symporter
MLRLALHWQILIGMAVGAAVGLPLNILAERGVIDVEIPRTVAMYGNELGGLFLQLLSMIVVPLIMSSLISGITSLGKLEGLARLGGRTVSYYLATSMLAIIVGIIFVNIIRPGVGADLKSLQQKAGVEHAVQTESEQSLGQTLWGQVKNLVPTNVFHVMSDPDNESILGVIFFSLILGVFIIVVGGEAGAFLTTLASAIFDVMMKMTLFIIHFAPIGVLGFMLYATAGEGLSVFAALSWYMLTVFLALSFHALITLPLLLLLVARRSPFEFFKAMSPALLTAFSTASSNGTLPLTLSSIEERAKVPNRIGSFVLPLGATINMDGTALYEAVAVLFIAQATPDFDLTLGKQVIVAVTALLASIGAAGIPHAGTVMMLVVMSAVGLPVEAVGLILAVDRILDMCRTAINVWSDSTAAAVVAKLEENSAAKASPKGFPIP